MIKNPMLSIYVPTFNHENYIVKALDSILMQKTKYSYEVLVGEDCSTDSTRSVLKEYERAHPGFLTVFYREKNMNRTIPCNSDDLKLRCRGKYMICLEGDDYWISDNKIESQINFLESHPEYNAVAHKCIMVDENSIPLNRKYAECTDSEYSYDHFFRGIMPGQTTTLMVRNYVTEDLFDRSLLFEGHGPGDRRLYYSILTTGRIYVSNEVMSAYRFVTTSGSSFSANNRYCFERLELISREFVEYSHANCNDSVIALSEMAYIREVLKGVKTKSIGVRCAIKKCLNQNLKKRNTAIILLIKMKIMKEI